VRKLWYAGAGMIAGGLFLFGGTPALADAASPSTDASVASQDDPLGDVLAGTNGLRLSSPVGSDPLGRSPLLTLDRGGQQLFQVKPGQNDIAGHSPAGAHGGAEEKAEAPLPAADVIGGSVSNHPGDRLNGSLRGVPLTDTNTGQMRLPLVGGGRLPIVGGLLPDGSHTLESTSSEYPLLDDMDGDLAVRGLPKRLSGSNRTALAGLPLGGSPVGLLPEATPTTAPTVAPSTSTSNEPGDEPGDKPSNEPSDKPSTSPYASTGARPGLIIPSAAVSAAPSASEVPYAKVDDPRMLEEPVDAN
jgi:hypothetical protein